jgi:hypothetical protein
MNALYLISLWPMVALAIAHWIAAAPPAVTRTVQIVPKRGERRVNPF